MRTQAIAGLARSRGVLVSDDPHWSSIARLGLLPLREAGALPERYGYLAAIHNDVAADRKAGASTEYEPPVAMNPILRFDPATRRERLLRGRAYLDKLVGQLVRGKPSEIRAVADVLEQMEQHLVLGEPSHFLRDFAAAARQEGIPWTRGAASAPVVSRLTRERSQVAVAELQRSIGALVEHNLAGTLVQASLQRLKGGLPLVDRSPGWNRLGERASRGKLGVSELLRAYRRVDRATIDDPTSFAFFDDKLRASLHAAVNESKMYQQIGEESFGTPQEQARAERRTNVPAVAYGASTSVLRQRGEELEAIGFGRPIASGTFGGVLRGMLKRRMEAGAQLRTGNRR